jgi:hypothetical protein
MFAIFEAGLSVKSWSCQPYSISWLVTAKSWTFGILPCFSSAMFFNIYSLGASGLARAIFPNRSTFVFPIYFRFLIF